MQDGSQKQKFIPSNIKTNITDIAKKKHARYAGAVLLVGIMSAVAIIARHNGYGAAAPATPAEVPATFNDTELLVKLKPSAASKANQNSTKSGLPGIDSVLKDKKVKKFERINKPGKKSASNSTFFNWYKITIDPAEVQTKVKSQARIVNARLEALKKDLAKDADVAAVEENYSVVNQSIPNDSYYSSTGSWGQAYADMWGMKRINPETGWTQNTGSKNIVVADIDTGVDMNHSELASNMWTNTAEVPSNGIDDDNNGYVDDVRGWNWVSGTNSPFDDNGHGTHTAGTIAGVGNNSAGIVGVNWTSSIMPLKFLKASGSGDMDNATKAIVYAADMGAKVASNSWGCNCHSQMLDDAIKYAQDKGMIVVAAAGNNYGADSLDYSPASSDGVITVGATDPTDALAYFSNKGSRIDVVAPGVDILSAKASLGIICSSSITVGNNYCRLSGTSMATPHVSGLAALILSANPSLGTEDVRQILRSSTSDIGVVGRDSSFGYGMINVTQALNAAATKPPQVYISSPASRSPILPGAGIDVVGTAAGNGFVSYKLELGYGRNPTSLTTLKTSTTAVTNGVLGTINPNVLDDGQYIIRLTATSSSGKTYVYENYDLSVDNIDSIIGLPQNLVPIGKSLVKGTATSKNGTLIANYKLDYGVGNSPSTWINTGMATPTSNTSVSSSTLTNWDTSSLVDNQVYTIRLTTTTTLGTKEISMVQVTADKNLVSGFPIQLTASTLCNPFCSGTPAFADLDGDGSKEVIIASPGDNKIFAYHKDGTILSGFPTVVNAGDWFKWPVTIADVNNDNSPEIIAMAVTPERNARLYIVNKNGQQLPGWPVKTFDCNEVNPAFNDITPAVADLDNDGVKEIVVLNIYWPVSGAVKHTLNAMHYDGTQISGFPKELPIQSSFMSYPLAIADLDKDGKVEIATGNYNKFYLFDNQGNLLPGWPYTAPNISGQMATFQSSPSIGDIDGDGKLEIFSTATPNGALGIQLPLFGWNKDGSMVAGFPQQTGQYGNWQVGWPLNNSLTADIDNDGKDEVIVGFNNLTIHKQAGIMSIAAAVGQGSTTISDFSGDGNYKLTAGRFSETDAIQLLNKDGTVFYKKNTQPYNFFSSPFVSADMDNNGKLEYAGIMTYRYSSNSLLYLWEMPTAGLGSWPVNEWPMYGQNPANTNHFNVGSRISSDKTPPTVNIVSPTNNVQVSASVVVDANVSDNIAINKVEFYVDGQLQSTDSTKPYGFTWDSKKVTNGVHTLMAKAYDVATLTSTSSITVNVSNIDLTPPTVSMTYPINGGTVPKNSNITITANAADDVKLAKVDFYVDGVLKCSDSVAPYSCIYKVASKPGVKYTFLAKAFDSSNNSAQTTAAATSK